MVIDRDVSVEFRIPVSPTRHFALMLSVLSRSIEKFGGLHRPRIRAMIGASANQEDACHILAAWLAPEMLSTILDHAEFDDRSIHATSAKRLTLDTDADVVVLMDADTVVCGNLSQLCRQIKASPVVSGVVAHVQPCSHAHWCLMHEKLGLRVSFPYRYTGWPYMWNSDVASSDEITAPAYFNLGFVVFAREHLARIGAEYQACLDVAAQMLPKSRLMFQSQVALTLAIAKSGAGVSSIPMRYNFPNDYRLEALFPAELNQAKMIHLLRTTQGLNKHELYSSIESLERFVAESWRWAGANSRARHVVEEVLDDVKRKGLPEGLAEFEQIW